MLTKLESVSEQDPTKSKDEKTIDLRSEKAKRMQEMFESRLVSMVREKTRNNTLISPDNECKEWWDTFVTLALIFTCIVTPYRIALVDEDTIGWTISNYCIDCLFLIDILIIFNCSYYDEDSVLVEDRSTIA